MSHAGITAGPREKREKAEKKQRVKEMREGRERESSELFHSSRLFLLFACFFEKQQSRTAPAARNWK